MCSEEERPRPPRSWNRGIRNLITNWDQPLPLRVKLSLLVLNLSERAVKRSSCCGHYGEPGC
jgi:hypothetical protein